MPTYDYTCRNCGHDFRRVESIARHVKARPRCPAVQEHQGRARIRQRVREDGEEELASCQREPPTNPLSRGSVDPLRLSSPTAGTSLQRGQPRSGLFRPGPQHRVRVFP